jgi:hypothetical protein
MADEAKNTAEEQVNNTETVTEAVVETRTEETVGETISEKKPESVPLAAFLELKKDNKELSKQMKELQKTIEAGATAKQVESDIKSIADAHNVDADFLDEFAAAIEKRAEEKVSAKLKPLEEKEKQSKINAIFEEKFGQTIESMPEYKDIVNKDVIKSLSLDPANQNKTWRQIIEGAYGHLIVGKKTLESSTARGGKDDNQDVDFDKARTDSKYFSEVMANPELKKKYNATLAERLKL